MGTKYCPKCRKVVLTKVLPNYSQVDFKGIRGKRRKIAHLEKDGGCGESLRINVEANDLWWDNPWASLPNFRIWIKNDWRIRWFGSCRINVTIRS